MAEALARVGDDITHANAATGGIIGGVLGFLGGVALGVAIGAAVIAGAAALAAATVVTGGAALIVAGAWMVAIGGTIALGGMGGKLGANLGAHVASGAVGPPKGKITRGSPTVFANGRPIALSCWSQVACQDHSGDQRISEGSKTVFANGHAVARIGDRGMCGFYIRKAEGNGSPDVFVGGDPKGCHGLPVGSGAPELLNDIFTGMEWVGGGVALVGMTLMTFGGGWAAASAAGLTMTARLGVSIAGQTIARVGAQVAVGWGLSKAGSLGGSLIGGTLSGGDPFWSGYGGDVGAALTPFAGGRAFRAIDRTPWIMPGQNFLRPIKVPPIAELTTEMQGRAVAKAQELNQLAGSKKAARSANGPVLTLARDLRTGREVWSVNKPKPPPDLDPVLQRRLDGLLRQSDGKYVENLNLPGSHSEVWATNELLAARRASGMAVNEASLNEIALYNVWANPSGRNTVQYGPAPRCWHCFNATQGVRILNRDMTMAEHAQLNASRNWLNHPTWKPEDALPVPRTTPDISDFGYSGMSGISGVSGQNNGNSNNGSGTPSP